MLKRLQRPFAGSIDESPLDIRLFGAFSLRVQGVEAARLSRSAQYLTALFALKWRSGPVMRAWLADTLWPDAAPERAAFYLRRSLTELRAALGPESGRLTAPRRVTLSFDFNGASCDVVDFDRLTASREEESLETAIALYRGTFLEGSDVAWALPEQTHRLERYLTSMETLAELRENRGDIAGAVDLMQTAVRDDPLRESARRKLMRLCAGAGDLTGMERQYRELRGALRQAFHVEPGVETEELYQKLRAVVSAPAANRSAGAMTARIPPFHNLPHPLTSFVGRLTEREQVRAALGGSRLTTLVGPGGVGKTRLALFAAESVAGNYSAGVCFVDMSVAASAADALRTVTAALNLSTGGEAPLHDALTRFLQPRVMLLIIDNAEQIADACAVLIDGLLRACPRLAVLVTSRQPLSLAGEFVLTVSSLPVPESTFLRGRKIGEDADFPECDSVLLLRDRVRAAAPTFHLAPEDAPVIAEICRALDGLPLALELVAIRFRSLSPREIAARLDIRLRLLTGGSPALPRHRTLHAALDWSYDLLQDAEKRLLRLLTVFRGGWTLPAAEAVCPQEGTNTDALLTALVEKSLVVFDAGEEPYRYRLLEMTRQYAEERMDAEECAAVHERHAVYFYELAQSADTAATLPHFPTKEESFPRERDNFGAAHAWLQRRDPEKALWLEFYLYQTTLWSLEDLNFWLARLEEPLPVPLRLRILDCVGRWAVWRNHAAAERTLRHSLEEAKAAEEPVYQIRALDFLSTMEEQRGDFVQAWRGMEEVLRRQPAGLNPYYISRIASKAAMFLGRAGNMDEAVRRLDTQIAAEKQRAEWASLCATCFHAGELLFERADYERAEAYWNEGLRHADPWNREMLPYFWQRLGQIALNRGDFSRAKEGFHKSSEAGRQNGSPDREGWALYNLAEVAFQEDRRDEAESRLLDAMRLFQAIHEPHSIVRCLISLAEWSVSWRQHLRAAVLLGSVDRAQDEYRFRDNVGSDALRLDEVIRAEIGPDNCANSRQWGQQLTLMQAIDFAAPT